MPKRIPTPPMAEEADFCTVSQPFPLNFEWEQEPDIKRFVRWIAACIGSPTPVWAFYYKPSAPAKIIIEIEKRKDNAHKHKLLGEHRWKDMLQNPSLEESGRVSQIFPCWHTNGREVQKDGWLRVGVQDDWFKNWIPSTTFKVDPYPETHFCEPPHEDKTNRPLCRPLPIAIKPPPPRQPKIVPGSGQWAQAKAAPDPRSPAALRGAWAAGRGRGAAAGRGAWNKPIVQNNASGLQTNKASAVSAWNMKPAVAPSTSAAPPGLGSPPAAPPGLVRSSSQSTASSSQSLPPEPYDRLANGMYHVSISQSQEQALYAAGDDEDGLEAPWGSVVVGNHEEPVVNLWATEPTKPVEKEPLCPVHQRVCKKGICGAYAELLKRIEKDNAARGIKKKHTGPYNIKVAERERQEQERAEAEKRRSERRSQAGSAPASSDDDGFTTAKGKKSARGGRGRVGARRQNGGRTNQRPVPVAAPAQKEEEEEEEKEPEPW
ncbi:hypothetical protein BDZ89DRAFT_1064955 [Hymenopellis radicata]|nr:hypothetical protein BDZ89DRAFT_1064955 [Hymenopellis radicata]